MATKEKDTAAADRRKETGVKKYTRHEAERQVAATTDETRLNELMGHPNKHVQKNARFKLDKIQFAKT